MNVYPRRELFRRRPQLNIYRMFFLILLILGGIWLILQLQTGTVQPLFLPTPTPTRTGSSFALEGDAQFIAGNLDASITAYQEAVRVDPGNAEVWAELARIQTYSTTLLLTGPERLARMQQALDSIDQAAALAPDDSTVRAIRAFVLDWYATLIGDDGMLLDAEQEAVRALQLDNQNTLALAFYAEILVDQQKWVQAQQYIETAVERDPSLMDVHRIYAYVLETLGQYNLAIQEYDRAIVIAPNLTFLYLRAGANYRRLAFESLNEQQARDLYNRALEYFALAVKINEQLRINDPTPFLSIGRTYSQMGEFFIAARNVQRALEFDPANADIYGQLGIIYWKSRNFEGSIPALKCAVRGCTAEESCEGRGGCGPNDVPAEVTGLPLSSLTSDYYLVYGSVLAGLSRPEQNYCPEALSVLFELRAFSSDPIVLGNIVASEQICASLGVTEPGPMPTSTPVPTSTPRP